MGARQLATRQLASRQLATPTTRNKSGWSIENSYNRTLLLEQHCNKDNNYNGCVFYTPLSFL